MTGSRALWLADKPLVLASKSAARRNILQAAGLPLEIVPVDIDERAVETASGTQMPGNVAGLLAREKAKAVAAMMPGRLVLGADQTLAAGVQRFSKPLDRNAAVAQLEALSGRTHELHSAIAIMQSEGGKNTVLFEHRDIARMTMRKLSPAMIDAYLDAVGDAALTSVGAYQVEGPGIQLFERIEGDYFTILGLPLLSLLAFLRARGAISS